MSTLRDVPPPWNAYLIDGPKQGTILGGVNIFRQVIEYEGDRYEAVSEHGEVVRADGPESAICYRLALEA
jgi:hypothetical protein